MNRDYIRDKTINIYLQIAKTAQISEDFTLSNAMLLAAYNQAKIFSPEIGLKILINLAELLVMGKLTKQAEEIFNLALKTNDESDNHIWLRAKIYDGLSEIHIRHSNFEKARKACEQAISILVKLPGFDPVLLSSKKRKLALINLHQGNNDQAHKLFQQAQQLTLNQA